ncbi:hypothetical protein BDQ17DRAFT_1330085 [Cyathus striatus]|nr:hypothetical protein BDQ17DRAFT_1330085 [Cyathus striatus]
MTIRMATCNELATNYDDMNILHKNFLLSDPALRRNVVEQEDIQIAGHRVKKGEFVLYSMYDVHTNQDIYRNPKEFDPDRYSPGREEDKKRIFAFLGWGAVTAYLTDKVVIPVQARGSLTGYHYNVVDASGNYPKDTPGPDYNDLDYALPIGEPCFFKFRRKMD